MEAPHDCGAFTLRATAGDSELCCLRDTERRFHIGIVSALAIYRQQSETFQLRVILALPRALALFELAREKRIP
jgi:hypothetical protein